MMQRKVAELEGAQLDYWVAKAEFGNGRMVNGESIGPFGTLFAHKAYNPSTNQNIADPIIEREGLHQFKHIDGRWSSVSKVAIAYGTTPLEAAMRCYVASKFGEEVPE